MDTFVKKPTDWLASGIPLGSGDFDLKQYAEMKVNRLKKGIALGGIGDSSYLKVRDASEDANGNRTGTQKVEFLRTTPLQSFGADVATGGLVPITHVVSTSTGRLQILLLAHCMMVM